MKIKSCHHSEKLFFNPILKTFFLLLSLIAISMVTISCENGQNRSRKKTKTFKLNHQDQDLLLKQYIASLIDPSLPALKKMLDQDLSPNQIFRNPNNKFFKETPGSVILKFDPDQEMNIKKLELLNQYDLQVNFKNGHGESLKYLAIIQGKVKVFYYLNYLYPFYEDEFSKTSKVDLIKASLESNNREILNFILLDTNEYMDIPLDNYNKYESKQISFENSQQNNTVDLKELIGFSYQLNNQGVPSINKVNQLMQENKYSVISHLVQFLAKNNYSVPSYFQNTHMLNQLSQVISDDSLSLMKLLLENNLNADGENELDIPIHQAVAYENQEAIQLLIDYNANEDILDNLNYNPLFRAIKIPSYETFLTLMSRGADTIYFYTEGSKQKTRNACTYANKLLKRRYYKRNQKRKSSLIKIIKAMDC